jgi:hypothetical protein
MGLGGDKKGRGRDVEKLGMKSEDGISEAGVVDWLTS